MMKIFKVLLFSLFMAMAMPKADAQCSMCSLNAENSVHNGNSEGKGLNKGILFLLAMPYLAAAGVGLLWYKKYRRRKNSLVENTSIHLN